jgi:hypothetical protein
MSLGRCTRAWIVASATLICSSALQAGGAPADAHGLGLSLPSVGIPLPSVGATAPSAGISLPSVGVSLPSVGVTVPSVGVSLPGVSVSTPEVSVSTPEVSVKTPEVSVTTPTSGGGSSEAPTGSSPTGGEGSSGGGSSSGGTSGGGSSGGGASSAPSSPSSGGSGNATAASVADSTGAKGSSSAPASTSAHRRSTGAGARGTGSTSHTRGNRAPSDRPGSSSGATAGADTAGMLGVTRSGAPRASRGAAPKHSSSPLASIGSHIPLPLPVPDWSKPIIIALLALAIGFGIRSRRAGRRAHRLERQRVLLLRDVGSMQAALVPEVPARVGGLGVSVAYRPADGPAAGGDFYDVFVPARGKVAIILGDVAGHGREALTQAALTRYTLRAYLQTGLEPRAALALAGSVLADPEAEQFATVALAVYDTRAGSLTYASAGHPAPLVQGPQMREPLEVCASPPIGWTVPTGRRQTTISLAPGTVVCFFSDGLIEARCRQDLLGRERLGELLAGLGARPDAAKLLARVRQAALATPDDMAACILAPEIAVIADRTHVEELEVEARALATGRVKLFLEACEVADADVEMTIEQASDIVRVWGSALLRVELEGESATATVAPSSFESRAAMPGRRPHPAGEPSGAR